MIEDATRPTQEVDKHFVEPHVTPSVTVEPAEGALSLDLKEASFALGKSMRALERSLTGKWGNRLPDGWSARKHLINGVEDWRVYPPAGFNLDLLHEKQTAPRVQIKPRNGLAVWKKEQGVVSVLKELAAVHRELADERRSHVEDLRLLHEAQASMRLLQCNANETAQLKEELLLAQKDLISLKNEYQALLKMPWWKRLLSLK